MCAILQQTLPVCCAARRSAELTDSTLCAPSLRTVCPLDRHFNCTIRRPPCIRLVSEMDQPVTSRWVKPGKRCGPGRPITYEHGHVDVKAAPNCRRESFKEYGSPVARKRVGIIVLEASGAGLAQWSGQIGVIHGDRSRSRLNPVGRSRRMTD